MTLRSPIVSVLGHVDHGKSSILDAIRGSNILATEAGAITQAIGASIIPLEVIKKKCGPLLKTEFSLPGLLFIDTPGHAAFTSLRKRGGSLADIAIVVIDIREGFKPQTIEAIEILRQTKTPFIMAANKMDLIPGYRKQKDFVLQDIASQEAAWQTTFETRIYDIVGQMHERFKMEAERFDRISNFTKQIAIVPTSAAKNHGIAELLMVLTGLAQRFLEQSLNLDVKGPGKATILEIKETQGFGTTLDIILYDGTIKRNDTIVIGTLDEPIVTKVRALLEPNPLQEMRDKKSKYRNLHEATAATGLKIAAPDLEGAVAGMPLRVARTEEEVDRRITELKALVKESLVPTEKEGVVIKADTLGSLEALSVLLKEKEIPVRKASVGEISKKDIADAESSSESNALHSAILGFNIKDAASTEKVNVITSDVIYQIIDEYEQWVKEQQEKEQTQQLMLLHRPAKAEILQNCIFRQSNPCIAGVEILAGTLKTSSPLMNKDGDIITTVKSIQRQKESVGEAKRGEQVALSLPGVTAGKHVDEHDILYVAVPQDHFRQFKKYSKHLTPDEKDVLKEIAEIMRKKQPLWGI